MIERVDRDFARWSYNTAVAACMEFVNVLQPYARGGGQTEVVSEAVDTLLLLLAPMTPHLTAEAWALRHGDHIHLRPWPVADPVLAAVESVTMVIQVNGKVRDRLEVAPDLGEAEAERLALASAPESWCPNRSSSIAALFTACILGERSSFRSFRAPAKSLSVRRRI